MGTNVGEKQDAVQMISADLHKKVQQKGVYGKRCKFVLDKIFFPYLGQQPIDFIINLRVGVSRQVQGPGQDGLDTGKTVKPGKNG